jgi:serine/threonine protein kinase
MHRFQSNTFYIGSREHRAPELLLGCSHYTEAVDLWALGCLLVELYHGVRLFKGKNNNDVLADIIKILGVPTSEDL